MEEINSQYSTTNDEDYISKLPDFLIHHILSFVKVEQAVQTCILSKRWRTIWTSLPFLRFDDYANSLDFVESVLSLRDNRCSDIRRFHLLRGRGSYRCDFIDRFRRWIIVVARSNVEDIDVEFCGDISDEEDELHVPSCVSTCKSLTKLELYLSKCKISLPNSISLPLLKRLKLYKPSFDHDESITKLCTNSPFLEHLGLYGVSSSAPLNINVSSLTLKHFELHISYHNSIHNTLRLCAPNLVYLGLSNLDYMLLEDVSSLVTADIGVQLKPRKPRMLKAEFPTIHAPDTLKSLKSLHNVKDLTMSFWPLKDVRRVQEVLQKQPFQFSNLQRLKLQKMSLSTDSMHAIASLVKISPIIESLKLELCQEVEVETGDNYNYSDTDESGPDEGSDLGSEPEQEMESDPHTSETTVGLQELLAGTMKHLKSVKISGLQGSDYELEFIQILMKNAMVLEKMVLSRQYDSRIEKFCEQVENLPSASSSMTIYFHL